MIAQPVNILQIIKLYTLNGLIFMVCELYHNKTVILKESMEEGREGSGVGKGRRMGSEWRETDTKHLASIYQVHIRKL